MALFLLVCLLILEFSGPWTAESVEAPFRCPLGTKPCQDGKECVLYNHVCDGEADCRDGSDEEDCVVACAKGQFQCAHGKKCIDQSQVCDGEVQCQDRSDEMNCLKPVEGCFLRCDDNSRCIPDTFLCDGERDCLDGTDEANCGSDATDDEDEDEDRAATSMAAPTRCTLGSKFCRDKIECVHYNHVCDGEADCRDGSDEEDCALECERGQFQCAHGKKCIDQRQVCDGVVQCQDRSDEMNCLKPMEGCSHHCDDNSRCIPDTFLCDGERDCLDGTDEADCANKNCSVGEFRCAHGQCVSVGTRCDGHPDCLDRSDEEDCAEPPECTTKHRCPRSQECLLEEWLCDREKDCRDGTDEEDCKVVQVTCGEFQWPCVSKSQCVPAAWRCDGMKDCGDGSDEAECVARTCSPHQFQCGSKECVDAALVCNEVTNCPDGSDEGGDCQTKCPGPDQAQCAQECYSTPLGTRCRCRGGYRLQEDAVSCVDVDECEGGLPGVCSQSCVNTQGSYVCQCNPGYLLESDGRSCKITGEPYLLASVQSELYLFGLRSRSLDVLLSSAKKSILSVDYDWREQKVFWVSLDSESIKWSSLDQKNKGTLVKGVKSDCIAVDWVGRNLYWIDGVRNQIIAIGLNSAILKALDYTVILDEDFEQPRSLALLPQKGIMFWSEIGNEPKIERAGMDGSDRRVVVSHSLSWPGGLALDALGGRVYWTDEKLKCIGSATLDGGDIKLLQMKETANPFSVTVFNDVVYWSDTKRRTIQGAHKVTGKNLKVIFKQPRQPFGLKVIHPLLQVRADGLCDQRACSHLCVLAPGPKAVCKCPSGLLLADDSLTCSNLVNSAFLLLLSPSAVTQIYLQAMQSGVGLKGWPEHLALLLPDINQAATMLDYTQRDQTLYLADAGQASVGVFKLKEAGVVPRGLLLQLRGDAVTALALDWVTLNVYWSSTKQPRLQVTSPGGAHTAVLIRDRLGSLEAVALHPPGGRLCFSNLKKQGEGGQAQVECAFMDGRNRTAVWKDAVQPTSLAFSNKGDEIYWADIGAGVIGSVKIDGTGYKEFKTGEGLSAFALSNSMFLWVTFSDTTKVWYRDDQQKNKLWFEVNSKVVSLKAYSKSSQTGSNLCSVENGNCHQLCLAIPEGRTCRCAHDQVSVNETHCAPDQRCPDGSRPCLDGQPCLPSGKFCDGHPDCPDHSDENCPKAPLQPPAPPTSEAPASTASLDPRSQVRMEEVEAPQCNERRCSGNGECTDTDGETSCVCALGYGGDSCQDQLGKALQGPVLYGAVGLCAGLVVIVVLAAVIKKRKTANARRAVPLKETDMTDLEKRGQNLSTQPSPNDTNFAEEVVSSVD